MAVPDATAPVPIDVEPLENVTVPVAAAGETVAVNVMLAPTATEVDEAVRVVVLAVVPPDVDVPLGACQKLPQPHTKVAVNSAMRSTTFLKSTCICFTLSLFSFPVIHLQ